MLKIATFMAVKGMTVSIIASIFVNFFIFLIDGTKEKTLPHETKIKEAMFAFVPLGFGMISGPLTLGYIQDKFGFIESLSFMMLAMVVSSSLLIM